MALTFLLARHAESDWNGRGMYQGRLDDSQLSPLGMRQAEALRDRLANRELTAVYSSPLRRALQTARIVAGVDGSVITRRELLDMDHGAWSGRSREEVAETWPELHRQWQTEPAAVRMPGGESLLEVRARALSFLAYARQEHADGQVVVITHGEVLQLMLAHFLQMKPDGMWSIERDNCGLSVI